YEVIGLCALRRCAHRMLLIGLPAARRSVSSAGLAIAGALDFEERVGKRDRRDVARQRRIDHEDHLHQTGLAGSERLALEAETLDLAEVPACETRCVARDRLPGDRVPARIDHP